MPDGVWEISPSRANVSFMNIIDGRKARGFLVVDLKKRIESLPFSPCLAIVQVGNREDSTAFIKAKKSFASRIGVKEEHLIFPENISKESLLKEIDKLNKRKDVNGIIVQLPLPIHLNPLEIIDAIDWRKDVDGLTSWNTRRCLAGDENSIMPATARGVKELLQFYKIDLFNKKVAVVGRSMLVGKPIAMMCLNQNATISICHSKTKNLEEEIKRADIVIVAIGKPKFIGKNHITKGQIVVDVGINRLENGLLCGDVDFEKVKDAVSMITPVPGGVGQMTVLALFENLVDICYNHAVN